MRHRKHHTKLTRKSGPRRQLIRGLSQALIEHGRIRTTETKAKALRPLIERLVTMSKKSAASDQKDVKTHYHRLAFASLQRKEAVKKLFLEIGPRFATRPGGYTRIIRDVQRSGDGAYMAYIEFVDRGAAAETAPAAPATTTA